MPAGDHFLVRRLLLFFPTLFLASIVVFTVMRVLPGDPATAILGGSGESITRQAQLQSIRKELRLDEPLPVQYGRWLLSLVNGEFGGRSLVDRQPLRSQLARQLPVTLLLVVYTSAFSVVVGVALGLVQAANHHRWPDTLMRVFMAVGQSLPSFLIGVLLFFALANSFRWTPPVVYEAPWANPWTHLQVMFWPTLVLSYGFSGAIARVVRAASLESLRRDFVRTARAKGLPERTIMLRHVLPNCVAPMANVAALYATWLMAGAVMIESVFGLPGLGRGMVAAVATRDYPVVQALAMLFVFFALSISFALNTSQRVVDRRMAGESR